MKRIVARHVILIFLLLTIAISAITTMSLIGDSLDSKEIPVQGKVAISIEPNDEYVYEKESFSEGMKHG